MAIVPLGTYSDLLFGSDDHDEHSWVLTPNVDPSPALYFWGELIGWTAPPATLTPPLGTIGFASVYTAPGGAIYVATDGDDGSGDGTSGNEFATLTHALSVASNGDTIVMRGGTYRVGAINVAKEVTIQGYQGDEVWFDGADIISSGSWVVDGAQWRLDSSPSGDLTLAAAAVEDSSQIDVSHPLAGSPQQVFRNGAKLTQVASKAAATSGKFFYDEGTNKLYIGDNPVGATTEVTTRAKALDVSTSNVTLRSLGFRNYGSTLNPGAVGVGGSYTMAAVQVSGGSNILISKCWFYRAAARGLFIGSCTGVTVNDCKLVYNGMNGVDVFSSDDTVIQNCRIYGNNAEGYALTAGAHATIAGSKVVTSDGVIFRDNIIDSNNATGIWFDLECTNAVVTGNVLASNNLHGIMYEVSGGAIIASNLIYRNTQNGIYLLGPNNKVWNNTCVYNGQHVAVYEDSRNTDPSNLDDVSGNVIKNNVFGQLNPTSGTNNIGNPSKYLDVNGFSYTESVAPGSMVTDLDYNVYRRGDASTTTPPLLGWAALGSSASYNSVAAIQSGASRETHGVTIAYSTALFTNAASDVYTLVAGSAALLAGVGLPSDVAAAVGVTAGVAVNAGALRVLGNTYDIATATGGYVGTGYTGMQPVATDLPGKGVLFSIGEGAIEAEAGDVPVGTNGVIDNDFDGGLGWATRFTYAWVTGRSYKFRVYRGDRVGDGQWWNAEVTDLTTNTTTQISRIKVPLEWLGINGYSVLFTERFGGATASCDDVEFVSADFTQLRANGTIPPTTITNSYASAGTCPNSDVATITGGVRHRMGITGDLATIATSMTLTPPDPNAGGAFKALCSFTPAVNFVPPGAFHLLLTATVPAALISGGGASNTALSYRTRQVVNGTPGVWTTSTNIGTTRVATKNVTGSWPTTTVWQIELSFIGGSTPGDYDIDLLADWTDA